MKSRLQPAMSTLHQRRLWRIFWLAAIVLVGMAGAAFAQDAEDPPGRVGYVSYQKGGVVFAPEGEEDWVDLPTNRPITAGDRLWTDQGARAEFQVGTTTLHLDGESHMGVSELEERTLKVILLQGSLNLRVREVAQGENVEVDTPNLAFRALQPGDYRIDVDGRNGETRVVVQGGLGSVFGEAGESIHLGGGQVAAFAGRGLAQVQGPEFRQDDFGLWAAERNRAEDQSVAARYVPRGVVGYAQLDQYGTWNQDPTYGAVWYPAVQVANWAPYRYGHWTWVTPWGWTWVDDAPWGFAPFHYGRWTMISNRWAWVPGRLAHRPVYSPALVVFLGGGGTRLAAGAGPAVGWYPLAPGEAWWPTFRHSPRYVGFANFNINLNAYPRTFTNHVWRQRPFAVTAVGEDDFRRGRPVYRHWQPLAPQTIGNAQINVVPVRPELRPRGEPQRSWRGQPAAPQAGVQPGPQQVAPQRFFGGREPPAAVREQFRAAREQERLQRDAERAARDQQRQAEAARPPQQPDIRFQRDQAIRQQQEQAGRFQAQRMQQEQVQRMQQEQAQRMQQGQRPQPEQIQRTPQEQAQREAQREAWRHQREQNASQPQRPNAHPQRPSVQPTQQQQQAVVPVPQQQVQAVQQMPPPQRHQQPPHAAPVNRGDRGGQPQQGNGAGPEQGQGPQGGGRGGRGGWR